MSTPEWLHLGIAGPIERRPHQQARDGRGAWMDQDMRTRMREAHLIKATPAELAQATAMAVVYEGEPYLLVGELRKVMWRYYSRLYTTWSFRGFRDLLQACPHSSTKGSKKCKMLPLPAALALMVGDLAYLKKT